MKYVKKLLSVALIVSPMAMADHNDLMEPHHKCQDTFVGDKSPGVGCMIPADELPVKRPADSDHDGVLDAQDRCPNTPNGQRVDINGCAAVADNDRDGVPNSIDQCPNSAASATVDVRGCALVNDSDRDGVPNQLDGCPGTLPNVSVDASGCEVYGDRDNDGVPDLSDRCPQTPVGKRVDQTGCSLVKMIELTGVLFETNSAVLRGSAKLRLDAVVGDIMSLDSNIRLFIEGHADSRGNDAYNLTLSQRRADSVMAYLAGRGLNSRNMEAKGYGEMQPVASNSTAEGQARNRRVVLRAMY